MVSKINHVQPGYEFSQFWKERSVGYFDWESYTIVGTNIWYIYTGWWFGTFFIFHFIYGMSSFPLTFNIFRGVKTTNQYIYNYIYTYIHIYTLRAHHQECIFHMRMRPQKRALVAAPFEHKPTDSQTHSPLPNCEETNCNGLCFGRHVFCLGRHVARKQARGVEPHVDKLEGDHATRNIPKLLRM